MQGSHDGYGTNMPDWSKISSWQDLLLENLWCMDSNNSSAAQIRAVSQIGIFPLLSECNNSFKTFLWNSEGFPADVVNKFEADTMGCFSEEDWFRETVWSTPIPTDHFLDRYSFADVNILNRLLGDGTLWRIEVSIYTDEGDACNFDKVLDKIKSIVPPRLVVPPKVIVPPKFVVIPG